MFTSDNKTRRAAARESEMGETVVLGMLVVVGVLFVGGAIALAIWA